MRRTAEEAAQTRRQVLDAALLAFAERGWDGATFEGIAARVGVTRGAVHHHFRSKDELLRAVVQEHWDRHGAVALAPLRDVMATPTQRLTRFLARYLQLLSTDAGFRALATVTTLVAPRASSLPDGLDDHRRSLDLWREELRIVLADPGVLRPGVSVDAAVFVIVNFLTGLTVTVATEPSELPATDLALSVATAVLTGLLPKDR